MTFCLLFAFSQVTAYNEPKDDTPLGEVQDQFFEMCKNDESENHWVLNHACAGNINIILSNMKYCNFAKKKKMNVIKLFTII